MDSQMKKIVIVATPTAPLLRHVLHTLAHTDLIVTLITRETSINFSEQSHDHHDHESHGANGGTPLTHKTIKDFSADSLSSLLEGQNTLVTILTGTDLHLTPRLVEAATASSIRRFLPSEYGLDSSNASIRALLPPYQTRWSFQEILQKQENLHWTALYAGSVLEDALKPEGVLGIDVLWGSVSAFGGREVGGEKEIVLTAYSDLAKAVVGAVTLSDEDWAGVNGKAVYASSYVTNLEEVVEIVQRVEDRDREYDWYEALVNLAKKEADERMKLGYFDGAVALLTKVAVWDESVDTMGGWKKGGTEGNKLLGLSSGKSLEEALAGVMEDVRNGKDDNDCGC